MRFQKHLLAVATVLYAAQAHSVLPALGQSQELQAQAPLSSTPSTIPGSLEISEPSPVRDKHAVPTHPPSFQQDGEDFKSLHLPVYEWKPADAEPIGATMAIHGLTLHGQSYKLLGKAFASFGGYFVAMDMRGFGRCHREYSPAHEFCVGSDCKWKINYEKSFEDIVAVARVIKKKYPTMPLTVMGESLGATLAVRLAGEHPELVDRLVVSAPAVKLSPWMFYSRSSIKSGAYAVLVSPRFRMNLSGFINNLVSNNPNIGKELMEDPLVLKEMSLADLLRTESCVERTIKYARKIQGNLPILIVQGSKDRCVVPADVVKLTSNTRSSDQTLRWLDNTGHLLLETTYLRAATISSINDWFEVHQPDHIQETKELEKQIIEMGGHVKE